MATQTFPAELTVTVTETNIATGEAQSIRYCPIAQAIRDIYPELDIDGVHVDGTELYLHWFLETGDIAVSADYNLPESARQFIDRFDNSLPVEPFTFVASRVPLREY